MKIAPEIQARYPVTDYDVKLFLELYDGPAGGRALVVGAHDECVAHMLSDAGFQVLGIDLREYDRGLPPCNYEYKRGDFCALAPELLRTRLPFDLFVSLSAIEHFGLGTYEEGSPHRYYDVLALRYAWDLLREGGVAAITIPMGGEFIEYENHFRVYNRQAANERLVQDFTLLTCAHVVAGPGVIIDGDERGVRYFLSDEDVDKFCGLPPHISSLLLMRKNRVTRLAPDGR